MGANVPPAAAARGLLVVYFQFCTTFTGLIHANLRKPPALRDAGLLCIVFY